MRKSTLVAMESAIAKAKKASTLVSCSPSKGTKKVTFWGTVCNILIISVSFVPLICVRGLMSQGVPFGTFMEALFSMPDVMLLSLTIILATIMGMEGDFSDDKRRALLLFMLLLILVEGVTYAVETIRGDYGTIIAITNGSLLGVTIVIGSIPWFVRLIKGGKK